MSHARAALVAVALGVLALSACGDDAELTGLQREDPLDVGAVTLPEVDESGTATPFAMKAGDGELLIVYFGYTNCPDLCPTTLTDLRTAFEQMGDDADRIAVSMVTVDPERDTAAVLNRYLGGFVERYHALRTEDPDELAAAEAAFLASSSVTKKPDGTVEVAHTANTYVVAADGTVVLEWPFGTPWRAMRTDLEQLLEDAA
jgi:protein SCO1/2